MHHFVPSKEMNFSTVAEDRRRLLNHCKAVKSDVLSLDLSKVQHCDSAGLAFLIEAKRLSRSYGKSCEIQGMTKSIHALAEFCGVDKILISDEGQ